MRVHRKAVLLALLLIPAVSAYPQRRETDVRNVHGTVVDKDENPVDTAIVYLKNTHTQDVRTFISQGDGVFRFSGLDPHVDYEIHAEHDGMISSTHVISNFDSRKEVSLVLKVDRKKGGK